MFILGPQKVNASGVYTLIVADAAGNPITDFAGTEAFSVTLWAGDDLTPAGIPTAAWLDVTEGKYDLTVPVAVVEDLTPGIYQLQVIINPDSDAIDATPGGLAIHLTAAPGSATAAATYGTFDQMAALASGWLGDLQSLDTDQAGFAEQRAEARRWLDQQVIARARATYERHAVQHAPVATVPALEITGGVDAGPAWGHSTVPDTTIRDQLDDLQTTLDANGLMVDADQDGGVARKIVAYYALHLVCDVQLGPVGETTYQALARRFKSRALRLLGGWIARVDTDDDGTADLELW